MAALKRIVRLKVRIENSPVRMYTVYLEIWDKLCTLEWHCVGKKTQNYVIREFK